MLEKKLSDLYKLYIQVLSPRRIEVGHGKGLGCVIEIFRANSLSIIKAIIPSLIVLLLYRSVFRTLIYIVEHLLRSSLFFRFWKIKYFFIPSPFFNFTRMRFFFLIYVFCIFIFSTNYSIPFQAFYKVYFFVA